MGIVIWIGGIIYGVVVLFGQVGLLDRFGISVWLALGAGLLTQTYLGLLSFVASEKSELKLFLEEIDGIDLCCCLCRG